MNIDKQGIQWGSMIQKEVGYGIFKLLIMVTLDDALAQVEDLEQEFEQMEDIVQSMDILAVNSVLPKNNNDVQVAPEMYDDEDVVVAKVQQLAQLMKNAKHSIVFTGAGISTSAGVPGNKFVIIVYFSDYRSSTGLWTCMEKGIKFNSKKDMLTALPTLAHMALVKLVQNKTVKHIVSQNCDGLHRRSGIKKQDISEVHGNTNLETCTKCQREYMRDFDACADYMESVNDHATGRYCDDPACKGALVDSIINFGEKLAKPVIDLALDHGNKADLCLVLGTSLNVYPANFVVKKTAENGFPVVIVNLQETPMDNLASLIIRAKTDHVMSLLMQALQYDIPKFYLPRHIRIQKSSDNKWLVQGLDDECKPFSFIKCIGVNQSTIVKREPFLIDIPNGAISDIQLVFFANYGEPPLALTIDTTNSDIVMFDYHYLFDPTSATWIKTPL